MRSLAARGGELEQSFAYGCVRQLFEREVQGSPRLEGAAALAGPALGQQADTPGAAARDAFAIHHGLYWLTVDLASATGGLLLAIDDAQWSDRATLEWIRHLVRRLDDVPALVILAVRVGEPQSEVELIDALTVEPSTRLARPAALTGGGVRAYLSQTLGDADEAVAEACLQASGGNPFLLGQLVTTMREQSDRSREALVASARASTPETVVRAIVVRLRRLGDDAVALAQAVAILGAAAQPHHAASLARLDERRAAAALDALVVADVVIAAAPLTFVHPLVRRAVYETIPLAERSLSHSRAARVLSNAGAAAELIAAQLLACSPAGDTWAVDALRACAAEVLARAPEAAVQYLLRALREPPPSSGCVAVRAELGRAELLCGDAGAVEHLRAAVERMEPGAERVASTMVLARAVVAAGGMAESVEWYERAAEDARMFDLELARECEIEALCAGILAPQLGAAPLERARGYPVDQATGTPGDRTLLALLAYSAAMKNERAAEVGDLADAALGDGTLVDHIDDRFIAFNMAVFAAIRGERFDVAAEQTTRLVELSRTRARPLAFIAGSYQLCAILLCQGRVWEAEAHGWDAVRFIDALPAMRSVVVFTLVDALLARGAIDEVDQLVVRQGLSGERLHESYANLAFFVRAKWHRAAGRPGDALEDLATCAERESNMGRGRSAWLHWRSEEALIRHLLGEHDKARRLASDEVELGTRRSSPIRTASSDWRNGARACAARRWRRSAEPMSRSVRASSSRAPMVS